MRVGGLPALSDQIETSRQLIDSYMVLVQAKMHVLPLSVSTQAVMT